jgi:hypothetical protein
MENGTENGNGIGRIEYGTEDGRENGVLNGLGMGLIMD